MTAETKEYTAPELDAAVKKGELEDRIALLLGSANKAEKSEIDSKVFTDYEDQFQWFLGAAIIILIIELLISSGKKDWETKFNFFEPKDENN